MKRIFIIVGCFFVAAGIYAQGSVQSFSVIPPSPTTADYVKVCATLMFTSGDCLVYQQGQSTVGNITDAFAFHCLGMLTYICNKTDTFNVGYLPSGNNVFRLTLDCGFGGPPCTPGIIPVDYDSLTFYVAPDAGLHLINQKEQFVSIYPNPFSTIATITIDQDIYDKTAEIKIYNIYGEIVKVLNCMQTNELKIDRSGIADGLYFYQLMENGKNSVAGKFIIE